MRRTVAIAAARSPVLVTEYALTYTPGLTIINTGQTTVWLGDDSTVNPANGIPLTPGMSTAWSSSPQIYAAALVDTTILITDNASTPLTANLPQAMPTDQWNWAVGTLPAQNIADYGSSTSPQLNPSGSGQCAYNLTLSQNAAQSGQKISLLLVPAYAAPVTLAVINPAANVLPQNFIGLLTGLTIPFGGYQLALVVTTSGDVITVAAPSTATLVAP